MTPPPAACMLVVRPEDGRVLAVTRRDDHTDWGLPGGKLEPERDISIRAAAVRETYEETGVTVYREEPLYTGPSQRTGHLVYTFVATAWRDDGLQALPGEGLVDWREWSDVLTGSFDAYNRIVLGRYEIWRQGRQTKF